MKNKSILIGIALLALVIVACAATSFTTPGAPAETVLPPTNTAFAPSDATPTATTVVAVPPTNAVATALPLPPTPTSGPGQSVVVYQIHMSDQSKGWGLVLRCSPYA